MLQKSSDLFKFKRLIIVNGIPLMFKRSALNEFNEPTNSLTDIKEIRCFYHVQNVRDYVKIEGSEGGRYVTKPTPKLLALFEDVDLLNVDDKVDCNGKSYKITGFENVSEMNVITDISLELI